MHRLLCVLRFEIYDLSLTHTRDHQKRVRVELRVALRATHGTHHTIVLRLEDDGGVHEPLLQQAPVIAEVVQQRGGSGTYRQAHQEEGGRPHGEHGGGDGDSD